MMNKEDALSLFAVWDWNSINLPDHYETAEEYNESGKHVPRERLIAGLDFICKFLLDNAKEVLSKEQNWRLDEYLGGYLSDSDYEKYAEE